MVAGEAEWSVLATGELDGSVGGAEPPVGAAGPLGASGPQPTASATTIDARADAFARCATAW